jgi:hypothetical protein
MRYAAAVTVILLSVSVGRADVYRSIDPQGHVQYTDTPTPGAVLISTSASHPPAPTPAAAKPSTVATTNQQISAQLAQEAAKQAVQKDVEQTRAEQCKKAQEQYQHVIEARRLYNIGKDGEREYLSDADSDQMRVSARIDMESVCGKTSP